MHVCFVHNVCFLCKCLCVCMCVWRETERERETETKKQRQRHNRVGRVVTFWEFFFYFILRQDPLEAILVIFGRRALIFFFV